MLNLNKRERKIIILLCFVFILTEIIDNMLDHLIENSIIHSIIQILLFLILLIIVIKLFFNYKKKIEKLVPYELMDILLFIDIEKKKGILLNQSRLIRKLNITKPTMKKRLNQLIDMEYIYFEKEGNKKYIKMTDKGKSVLK
ncbi:MAG: hypothetical protein ACQER9_03650 [Nanobdellota archaeon]